MDGEDKAPHIRYDAFATYATDPDRDLVRDVEDFVESLHRDRLLSRQFREQLAVCVDGQDFRIPRPETANPKTLDQIMRKVVQACQGASRCLLVFSGPSTASHRWINAEVKWWREQPDFGPIFFVLTHGQVSETAGKELDDDAGQKNAVRDLLPDALTQDRAGLDELWFDLRGYYSRSQWWRSRWSRVRRSSLDQALREESSSWNKVRVYEEERFRLATQILALRLEKDLSKEDVLPKWKAAWRLKQRLRLLRFGVAAILVFAAVVIADRVMQAQKIEEWSAAAQAAVNDQEYERAIKLVLRGLPAEGDLIWRQGWSDAGIKKLLAVLAGASQMSAYAGQLKSGELEGPSPNSGPAPFRSAEFDPSGKQIVTASNAGSVTVWDSASRKILAACKQDEAFAGYPALQDGTTWVRDSRFGKTSKSVLSVGRYGAWIWRSDCSMCARDKVSGCEPPIRFVDHHLAAVRTGTYNADFSRIVTTSDDETVKQWDATNGRHLGELVLPPSDLPKGYRYTTAAEYSRDGASIVVGRRDGLIAVMNSETGREQQVLQSSGSAVWSVHFDSSGQRVLSSQGNGNVIIWDVHTGKPVSFFRQVTGVGKSTFSPDQHYILTTSLDNVARIWDATTLEQLFALKGHSRSLTSASYSADGNQIVTSSDDGTARIWNLGTSILPTVTTVTSKAIQCGAVSNDGQQFAVGTSDSRVAVFDISPNGQLTPGPSLRIASAVTSVSFGSDSSTIVVGADSGKIALWHTNLKNADQVAALPVADSYAASSPDGKRIAVASNLGAAQSEATVINLQEHTTVPLRGASQITGIEFNRAATRIAGASDTGVDGKQFAFVWDATSGKPLWKLKNPGKVLSAHFSQDGSLLATSTIDRKAVVWNLSSGRPIQTLLGHTYDVNSARLSSDKKRLVTASSDRTIRIWDVETGVSMLKFVVGREANDAFFVNDDNQIITITAGGDILTYDVSWTRLQGRELKVRTCADKLPDIDEDGLCYRTGSFSVAYWERLLEGSKTAMAQWIGTPFSANSETENN